MRFTVFLLLLLTFSAATAQEQNSLLWEISGNGLQQSSYLYGTMHVSKKIAFRLDDVFYEALEKSEKIALESDPSTWLENDMGNMGYAQNNGFTAKGFYTRSFLVRNPKKEELASYLAFEDRLINNILYRTNEYSQNFEEETYLDMFIYQAGSKFNKPIIALEDLEESTALVGRASLNAVKQKPDEWLQKKMQRQDVMFLMQDAYRERNISLLDSIDHAMYTDHYLKNMLYIRNANMANSLDSVMHTAKIFAGIGAAHLAGEKGVLQMLRDKGYNVEPLVSKSTTKGLRLKQKFETKKKENEFKEFGPDDQFFTLSLPNKLYPVSEYTGTTYISPDLANGSYLMVNRIPTFSFIKEDHQYTLDDIDKLLFENIPGKIVEKNRIKKNGFEGIDIRNQLKNGDSQRYQIFITPLEILIFKMGGEGDYVTIASDTIFNSLKFRKPAESTSMVSSGYKDFEIKMPSFHTFRNRLRNGYRTVEAYDSINDAYYFLRKATLNDFNFIEEDTFELRQIQNRFYKDLKITPKYKKAKGSELSSRALLDSTNGRYLHLKTVFRRGDYYLMGTATKDSILALNFLDSFKLKTIRYPEQFEKVRDTALYFTTSSTVEPPKFVENSNNYYQGRKKPKPYDPWTKKTIYQNKNDEAITVELTKSHDFLSLPNIDSVWALRKKQFTKKKFGISREERSKTAEGDYELSLTLTDSASTRGVLVKNVLRGGLLYELKAQIDTLGKPSRFVSEFFDNFEPLDTLIGRNVLEDKTADFFAALQANDSIISKGYRFLWFAEKHIDSLEHYISTFNFPEDKKHIQSYLIQKLGGLDDPRVISFFRAYYAKSYNNSSAQAKILQALSKSYSTEILLDLMSQDLPLVSNTFEIHKIFKPYRDSLALAKNLYPKILDYSSIQEYKTPIFSLMAELKSEKLISPKSYKKYRKQLLNDAKIQLKRHFGKQIAANRNRSTYNRNYNAQNAILEDYAILLYPFIHEKDTKLFFDRLLMVKEPRIKAVYAMLLAEKGREIPVGLLDSLASNINTRGSLFNDLKGIGKTSLFPSAYANQKALAEAALFEVKKYNINRDSVVFVGEHPLEYRNNRYNGYYFKVRDNQAYDKNFKMHLVVFEDGKKLNTKYYYKNEGLRIEDIDTDKEAMEYVTEEFLFKDRERAQVYRPNSYGGYGYQGY